jgi:hypothetical protein
MHTEQDEINKLREVLDYNPDTGVFRWKRRKWNRGGRIAGYVERKGYLVLHVFNKKYKAHRVAFALTYNRWPKPVCDHINRDKLDNRIVNLREATQSLNVCNSKMPKTNTSGVKGVTWIKHRKRWRAKIGFDGKHYELGRGFKTIEEAAKVVAQKRQELHGEFARD